MMHHPKLIQHNFVYLLDQIALESSLLLRELQNRGVISDYERERFDPTHSSVTATEGKERLLLMLARKESRKDYDKFLESLRVTNQTHVADKLTEYEKQHARVNGVNVIEGLERLSVTKSDDEAAMKYKIQQYFSRIIDTIEPFDVRPFLFESGALCLSDYELILSLSTDRRQQCKKLLEILYRVESDRRPFIYLHQALQDRYTELVKDIDQLNFRASYVDCPTLLQTVEVPTGVWGLAVLGDLLFIVLHDRNIVQIYKADVPYSFVGEITIEGLGWPTDLVADSRLGCLYISDRYGKTVTSGEKPGLFTVTYSGDSTSATTVESLALDVTPGGMSLTSAGRLVVVCENGKLSRGLRFYRGGLVDRGEGEGDRQRRMRLEELVDDRVELSYERYLLQATEIAADRFAISQVHKSTNVHRIFVIDEEGLEVCTFGGGEFPRSLLSPWTIYISPAAATTPSSDRLILANDCDNSRVVLLRFIDDHLEYVRDLISAAAADAVVKTFFPRRLCVDEARGVIYAGCGCKPTRDAGVVAMTSGGAALPQVLGSVSVWRIIAK